MHGAQEIEMAEPTRTQDGTHTDTWEDWPEDLSAEHAKPGLRLLYHANLARIGSLSHPDIPLTAGQWQTVGRKEPLFVTPRRDGMERPLEDPTISREQVKLRWLPDTQRFEVAPVPGAQRRVDIVDLTTGRSEPLTTNLLLPPGACIAIEERVLLGLEVGQYHDPDEDRLGLVGESPAMWRLRSDIKELSQFRRPTLILGQTGAGKELVAHAIHRHSAKSSGPFLTVNCAALPEHLVESILFGHRKGAFTGADAHHEGMFRAADGGTLFLDELGEMPMTVQPKLLRTLQDGQVFAIGQHKSVHVDVRLISATNRDPGAEIAAGRLREDLYHRVAGHIIRVPELRERRFDIPGLFLHFLETLRAEHPSTAWLWSDGESWRRVIPMSFFIELLRCSFSGNVRELENIAERTIRRNLTAGPFRAPELSVLTPSAPAPAIVDPAPNVPPPTPAPLHDDTRDKPAAPGHIAAASQALGLAHKTVAKLIPAETLARIYEHDADEDATAALTAAATERLSAFLTAHDGKQRQAAAALDVSPSTLQKLMQRFGIAQSRG